MKHFVTGWRLWLGLALAVLVTSSLNAQGVTTAAFSGKVMDANGQPVYGANVIATHEPSGTVFGAATRADGRFNMPAVRVGGPYMVRVEFIGYKTESVGGITVALGEDRTINFTIREEAIETEEIAIVAERNPIISSNRTGAQKVVTTVEIENLPTIARDFSDFQRLTPQFSGNSAAGRSNRYNNILIDGSVNNDLFGLAGSGTPGGQAGTSPISLDALQEFQIEIAPYDVRKGGFTGGGINAITRSGTNKIEASVYYYFRNEDFVGAGKDRNPVATFNEKVLGFRVGGPIQKDKLFFFVNGEFSRRNSPSGFGITGSGNSNDFSSVTGITAADAQQFRDTLISRYNYDPGSFGIATLSRPSTKFFVRLDYNLSEKHRLTLRHNYVNAADEILGRSTGTGSSNGFGFSNAAYEFANVTNSTVFQINSALANNIHNEAIVAYQTIRDKRDTPAKAFPFVRVTYGTNLLVAGTETFSQANSLDQTIFEFTDNLTYYTGDHAITVGTHNELFSFDNLFIRAFYGNYTFSNFNNFVAGTPSSYELSYSLDTTDPKPTAKFAVQQYGFYVQDVWKVMSGMNVTGGIRMDIPIMPDKPAYNRLVDSISTDLGGFLDSTKVNTKVVASGNLLFSPRLGINWDVFDDKKTQLRGGIGIFSGRTPYVWISNQYSNTGVEFGRTTANPGPGSFTTDVDNQPGKVFTAPTSEINVTDKNFKLPQVWRLNLGVDHELPFGVIGTVDIIASKNINNIRYQDINLRPSATTRQLSLSGDPDGVRPVFSTAAAGKFSSSFTNVIYLSNTDNGYEYNVTLQLQRAFGQGWFGRFDKGFFSSVAYTYGRALDENSGTSSQAFSNWRFNPVQGDPNHVGSATANYETRHRMIWSLSYTFEFVPKYSTIVSFFYNGFSGRPYSETYSGDVNGDGQTSNDLIYVPIDQNDINIVPVTGDPRGAAGVWTDLNNYIEGDGALDKARGKIIKRNASREPWTDRVDFHLEQHLPIPSNYGRFELTLDLLNVLNWLNYKWGQSEFVNNQNNSNVIYRGLIAGQPAFTFGNYSASTGLVTLPKRFQTSDLPSRWQYQIGLRYTF